MCVTGCPYKKIYFNHRTGKAEKCTFCFPRIEVGIPTVCSETCVGRLRYIGLVLYDADAVLEAASVPNEQRPLRRAARRVPRPARPGGAAEAAEQAGIPRDWIEAAQRSPVWALIIGYRGGAAAAPGVPHMPMVWYIPPLSPVVDVIKDAATTPRTPATCSAPSTRCASRSSTSPNCSPPAMPRPVRGVLHRLAAMRAYMRDVNLGEPRRPESPTRSA